MEVAIASEGDLFSDFCYQDEIALVMWSESFNNVSLNKYVIRSSFVCITEQCNPVDTMKSILRSLMIGFDYDAVMN